jgi:sterol desaturase/sphingolipid hydroxylase (fatty acid hydroxylase superfamily)
VSDTSGRKLRTTARVIAGTGLALATGLAALSACGVDVSVTAIQALRQAVATEVRMVTPWPALAGPLAIWTYGVVLAPHLLLLTGAILVLEWIVPAVPRQRVVSTALVNDFIWYLVEIGFVFAALAWMAGALRGLWDHHLGWPTLRSVAGLPEWALLALAVVASDFFDWLHHVIRHRVPVLWWFHTVHHGQRELNQWTNHRIHPMDYVAAALIRFVPVTLLGVSAHAIVGYAVVTAWYTRLYHANIRSNFGLLRFVLVTPQSHRVHHSLRPEHQDTNFGVLFSVWDHLFGTQCRDYDVYPETGVADPTFPQERGWAGTLGLRAFVAQHLYPLRLLWRGARRRLTAAAPA